jgi:hypothetical protein
MRKVVDARDKPGHDAFEVIAIALNRLCTPDAP